MSTSPIAPGGGAAASPLTGAMGGNTLGQEAFLQLLVTQLTNQDPLNPQDGHEFVAQLAQFSSVEQLTNMSSAMGRQAQQLAALAQATGAANAQQAALAQTLTEQTTLGTASALIGRTVDVPGDAVVWNGTDPSALAFRLDGPAAGTTITVRNAAGEVVRTIDAGHFGTGTHAPQWDGLGDDGQPLPAGAYTFRVEAVDAQGEDVPATTFTRGRVDRITVEAGAVLLWMGEHSFPLADVQGIV